MVDVKVLEIDELELVALGETTGFDFVGRSSRPSRRGSVARAWRRGEFQPYQVVSELNWNSGMYSDSSSPAMTTPITMSRTGWIRLEKRVRLVSFSSS